MEYKVTWSVQVAIRWMLMIVSGEVQTLLETTEVHIPNWYGFKDGFFERIVPGPIKQIPPKELATWSPYKATREVKFYYHGVHVATVTILGERMGPDTNYACWDFMEARYLTYLPFNLTCIPTEWRTIKRGKLPLMESPRDRMLQGHQA